MNPMIKILITAAVLLLDLLLQKWTQRAIDRYVIK